MQLHCQPLRQRHGGPAQIKTKLLGDNLLPDLRKYTELCCCKQPHKNKARKAGRLDIMALEWLSELAGYLHNNPITDAGPTRLPGFLPYVPKGQMDDPEHALCVPLGQRESEDGTLYMIGRRADPGFPR